MENISVIGAGLAGCEAALQLAKRGFHVDLYEMKKIKKSPAHKLDTFCELVCSNSLKSMKIDTAGGLLKEEMNVLGCEILKEAQKCSVPAGGALAVDRDKFSLLVTQRIEENENITIHHEVIEKIPEGNVIIATGPLTDDALANDILSRWEGLYFYDAASPIVSKDSIDMNIVYKGSRYCEIGDGDYLNCPMNEEEYNVFYDALVNGEIASLHEFDKVKVFEGCMPVEVMAKRGKDTLRFGLVDIRTGKRPYAVVQLRQEDAHGNSYNLVGFQTNLKFPEQKRIFSLIPGLNNAEFLRYGVMHRNTFLDSPKFLNEFFATKDNGRLFFAGQITGVEGYVESIASGMLAGINMARTLKGEELNKLPCETIIGGLCHHVANYNAGPFQPMNANFGIVAPLNMRIKDKKERYLKLSERSIDTLKQNVNMYV